MSERQISRKELRRQNQKQNKKKKGVRAFIVVLLASVLLYITGIYGASLAYLGDFISSGLTLMQFGKGWPVEQDFSEFLQAQDMGTSLCVLTRDGLHFYSPTGKEVYKYSHSMQHPVLATSPNRAVFYDSNQTMLKVANSHSILFQQEMGNNIIHADISRSNRVAVTTRSSSYDGEVTVFNFNMVPRFTWYCATGYPVYSKLSPDGNYLAALAVQSDNGLLQNQIYMIDSAKGAEMYTLISASYPVDMIFIQNSKLLIVYPESVGLYDVSSGDLLKSFSFAGSVIKAVEHKGQYIALAYGPYGRKDSSDITLLSTSLEEKATVHINENVKNLSISQSRVFALCENSLYEYNYSMELVDNRRTNGFAKALADFNGTTLIDSTSAQKVVKTRSK